MFWVVVALILVALLFDYINGFHDAANSIATVVSTRVLSPGWAVLWAAFFNFVAAFAFGTAVANTVGKGMIDIKIVTFAVILGGLTGAIIWDFDTVQDFQTVNGVKARGGSINSMAPVIAGGMLYITSGYSGNAMPGNVLLAFSVDGK